MKRYVSVTVRDCPEAWEAFCANFPDAIIMEDSDNPGILTVYTDEEEGEI